MNQALLMSLLDYDPDTGLFRWKFYERNHKEGWFAGAETPNGYLTIRIQGKTFYAHVLAWIYMMGYVPQSIDHVNRIKSDNRRVNLRETGKSGNAINSKRREDNTSGHKGVSWNESRKKWDAYINVVGRGRMLKQFKTLEEAVAWRELMEAEWHGEFAKAPGEQ